MSTDIVTLEVSGFVGTCKDYLTAEWADFKKSSKLPVKKVCVYNIGGPRDNPTSVLPSVASAVNDWELLLRDVVDSKVAADKPVLECEVVVGGDCGVNIFPKRHKINEVNHTTAYTVGPPPPPPKSAKRKKPVHKSAEEQFMIMVEQVGNYMLDHLKKISQPAVPIGDMRSQYLIIGSASLVRNRINYYKELLRVPASKAVTDTLTRANELIEVICQTVLNYHCDLLRSSLMHDPYSHDWTHEKRYNDGEKISTALRTWAYYIQGVRNDLFRYTAPQVAEGILMSVFSDTLNILITRYSEATPSQLRLPLYRGDVLTILGLTAALLPSLMKTPALLFSGSLHSSPVLSLHRRANLLLAVASVKAAPLTAVLQRKKVLQTGQLSTSSSTSSSLNISSLPTWLTFLNPARYPAGVKALKNFPPNISAYHLLFTAASNASPQWSLIVRALVQNNYSVAHKLLQALQNFWSGEQNHEPCGGATCVPHLCSPPLTPQCVYAAVLQIVYRAVGGTDLLKTLMLPGVLKPASWDSFDQTQVWNSRRPPWHHVLVQLAVPHILPVVQKMVKDLPPLSPAQPAHPSQMSVRLEHHLSNWTANLLQGVSANAQEFPLALIGICKEIQDAMPSSVKPAGGYIISQVVVSAIYGVINSRKSLDQLSDNADGITEDQWNMLMAMGERLCSLYQPNYEPHVKSMGAALLARLDHTDEEDSGEDAESPSRTGNDPLEEYEEEEVVMAVTESLTAMVLESGQGQHALGVVWQFLQHNMEWLEWILEVPPLLPITTPKTTAPQLLFMDHPILYNPLYYCNRIMYSTLDEEAILSHSADWELAVSTIEDWLPPDTVLEMLQKRPEFTDDAELDESDVRAVELLRPLLSTLHESTHEE